MFTIDPKVNYPIFIYVLEKQFRFLTVEQELICAEVLPSDCNFEVHKKSVSI